MIGDWYNDSQDVIDQEQNQKSDNNQSNFPQYETYYPKSQTYNFPVQDSGPLLQTSLLSSCLSTQVQLNNVCIDCNSIFGDCQRCSLRKDSINSLQCDYCGESRYLLRTSSQNLLNPSNLASLEQISICVADCSLFAYNYVNNPNTMTCEFCGDSCFQCSPLFGCLNDYRLTHGYKSTLNYPSGKNLYSNNPPTSTFATAQSCADPRCDICQKLDSVVVQGQGNYLQCDSCYQYVNFFFAAKRLLLTCSLCNSAQSNCLQCDSTNPSICLSCNQSFYLDKINNNCIACQSSITTGCSRCSATACLECSPGYVLGSNGVCTACDLDSFNSLNWLNPVRCSRCQQQNTQACSYCDQGYLGSLSNPTSCQAKCDQGQFPSVSYTTFNDNQNTIQQQTCQSCDLSCLTCVGVGPNSCSSCLANQYLQILNMTGQTGKCVNKISTAPSAPIEIFVTNIVPNNPQTALLQQNIGSFGNPFFDLEFALMRAQELAAQYSVSVNIVVYLFNGDHYVIRNRYDTALVYQYNMFMPGQNLNYQITIQPLNCSYYAQQVSSVCTNGKITIYNKQKEKFQIVVPQQLKLSNIIIDSLDSILYQISPHADPCLNSRQSCCSMTDSGIILSQDGSQNCQQAFQAYLDSQESQCLANSPRAMFKMQLNQQGDVKSPNTVVIDQSEIRNIFYALNSIIGLTPVQGQVQITNSVFNKLLMCGGIVKNYYSDVKKPLVQYAVGFPFLTNSQTQTISQIFTQQAPYQSNFASYNYVPAGFTCQSAICFSILIDSTTFSQIPFNLPNIQSYKLVSQANGLRYQGYILNLDGFSGPVTVSNSHFKGIQVPFETCNPTIPTPASSYNNFGQLLSAGTAFDKVQIPTLFAIINQNGNLALTSNQFQNNVMQQGLIIIDSRSGTTTLTGNNFQQNSAISSQNVLTIRQCTGVTLLNNQFKNNIGCSPTGNILLQCLANLNSFTHNSQFDTYTYVPGISSQSGSVSLNGNTYLGNFAGTDKHVVDIQGYSSVSLTSESYIGNENYLPQSFKTLSPLANLLNKYEIQSLITVTNLWGFTQRAQSILRIASIKNLQLSACSFQNNWIADSNSQPYQNQSNAILIQDLIGKLSIQNVDFTNNKGSSSSSTEKIVSQGLSSGLLVFRNVILTDLIFNDNSFIGNYGFKNTSDTTSVVPTLFNFNQDEIKLSAAQITVKNLTITRNIFTNSYYLASFNLKNLTLSQFTITLNKCNSILQIMYPTSQSLVTFQNGTITGNLVSGGATLLIEESPKITFRYGDIQLGVSQQTLNLNMLGVNFSSNQLDILDPLSKTSCILFKKTSSNIYPWFSAQLNSLNFDQNLGLLTNAIYFADSMVLNFTMTNVQWQVEMQTLSTKKLAQIIYSRNPFTMLSVTNSKFNCVGTTQKSDQIYMYNIGSTNGIASLFRISGDDSNQALSQLNPGVTDDGTLDAAQFQNQFSGNTYSNCNQIFRGSIFYLEQGAQLQDKSSEYTSNSALEGGIAYLTGDGTYLKIDTPSQDLSYIKAYYGSIVFATHGATAHLTNQFTVTQCEAYEGLVAYITNRARLILQNEITVKANTVYKQAIVSSIGGCQIWLDGVTFIDNLAVQESAIIFMSYSREQYQLVDGSAAIAYGKSNYLVSYILNSMITTTTIKQLGRLITVIEGSLQIQNLTSSSNYPINADTQGIYVGSGELYINGSTFSGQSTTSIYTTINQQNQGKVKPQFGSFLAVYGSSSLTVNSSSFYQGRANQGGCIAMFGDVEALITNTQFDLCAAMEGGAIFADGFSKLSLQNVQFTNNIAYQGNGQNIYAVGGTKGFIMDSCNLVSYFNSVFLQSISIQISNTNFQSDKQTKSVVQNLNQRANGGGLYIQDSLSVQIDSSNFTDLQAINGGGIYIVENTNSITALDQLVNANRNDYLLLLTSLKFVNCQASNNGGAIYLAETLAGTIQNSVIQGNATNHGGGIYFWCSPETLDSQIKNPKLAKKCDLTLKQNQFNQCRAKVGGGIFWNFIEPNMEAKLTDDLVYGAQKQIFYGSMTFTGCSAEAYGPQISGVAQQIIKLSSEQQFLQYYNQTNPKRQVPFTKSDLSSMNQSFFIQDSYKNVQSGGNVPTTYFALIDKYGQVVQQNQGQRVRFNLDQNSTGGQGTPTCGIADGEFKTCIIGTMDFYSMYGVYNMSNMGIFSKPDINISVSLTVMAIDLSIPSVRNYLSQQLKVRSLNNFELYRVKINLGVRSCVEGEGLSPQGACFTCSPGTFLLTIPTTATQCQVCQTQKSVCLGGSKIGPLPGYWRKSNTTYNFLPCKKLGPCLGMNTEQPDDMKGNLVGLCDFTNGYYGTLCSACLPGFRRKNNFECQVCSPLEPLIIGGSMIAIIIAVFLLIKSTIDGAASQNNTYSVFTKILLNHMQMLLIISTFNMQWPVDVETIFSFAAPIQQVTAALVSFDCFMDKRDPASISLYNFYADSMEFRIIYQKLIIMASLPIVLSLALYVVWWIILKQKNKMGEHNTKFVASMVLILFLIHPSVTQTMINMFDCQDLDGDTKLTVDLQVTCWEGMHTYMAYYLALPCLILWGLGIPLTVFFMMRKDADKLDTVEIKQKFGFLYNGFKRNNYYWEIVIMYRKVICIFIAIFLKKAGIIVQALVLLIVLVLFMQTNASNRPFSSRALNDIENLSMATQIATIYCGIFFISSQDPGSSSFDVSKDFYLTPSGQYFFFVVILLCNLVFLILWVTKFVAVIRILIKEVYPNLYVILFLCGRSDKMNLETIKRARDVKKESIIETVESVTLYMAKMKGMYSNDVFYQDHNRFLRLLYYIESERQQIDVTQRRHNYYIQGQIARHRKFDPEVIKEAEDQRILNVAVGSQVLFQKQVVDDGPQSLLKRGITKMSGLIKLQKTSLKQISAEEEKMADSLAQIPKNLRFKSQMFVAPKGSDEESLAGRDLLDASASQSFMDTKIIDIKQVNQEGDAEQEKKKETKKKKRKVNQADLKAVVQKSRNQFVALKSEKIERVNINEINQFDGSKLSADLPEYLKGFQDYSKQEVSPNKSQEELKLQSIESVDQKLHLMRKLTERLNKEESPQKSDYNKSKTAMSQSGATGVDTGLELPESSNSPHKEVGLHTGMDGNNERLPVYHDQEDFENTKRKLDFTEEHGQGDVVVVKGGGGQTAKPIEVEEEQETRQRMRPKQAFRHQLKGDQIVEVHNKKSPGDEFGRDADDLLKITIFDEDGEFTYGNKKQKSGLRRVTNQKSQGNDQDYQPSNDEVTESFATDPSMVGYDSKQEIGEQSQSQRAPTKVRDRYERNKEQSDSEGQMGEGLANGLNFHPQITPGLIFDTSRSSQSNNQDHHSDDDQDRDSFQNRSGALLIPQIKGLTENDKSRN